MQATFLPLREMINSEGIELNLIHMRRKRSTKHQGKNNLILNFSETGDKPDYLSMIASISSEAEDIGLLFEVIPDQESLLSLGDFLNLGLEAAALFSVLAELSLQEDVTLERLANFFKCKGVRVLSLLEQIEQMESIGLVKRKVTAPARRETYRDLAFTIPKNVMEALRTADPRLLENHQQLNFTSLLDLLKEALDEREDDQMTAAQFLREVEDLLDRGSKLPFVHFLNTRLGKTSSKALALLLVLFKVSGRTDTPPEYFFGLLFPRLHDQMEFSRNLQNGRHELVKAGVVKILGSRNDNSRLVLGPGAHNLLFIDFPELVMSDAKVEGLRPHKTIKEKILFFNAEVNERIAELEKVLNQEEFSRYRESAARMGMNHGITAIFYGQPGTGKTELALQIARKTRRDLMMVDLSQTRSMWFGESEKQVRRIFENYREVLEASLAEPILFINEADGLLSHRTDLGRASHGVAHTQNLIQNILLEELENFKGILIATTNLTGNLDKAFERRFLLKIDFPRPDSSVQKQIWLSKLPELTPEMAENLAGQFDLSGGQIDNQVKQLLMKRILNPGIDLLQSLTESCRNEQGFSDRKKIGYK